MGLVEGLAIASNLLQNISTRGQVTSAPNVGTRWNTRGNHNVRRSSPSDADSAARPVDTQLVQPGCKPSFIGFGGFNMF